MNNSFGLIIIGDELLLGDREDRHLAYFRQMLGRRGHDLQRCWFLPDERSSLIEHLHFSMTEALPVFVCGGIGATPDDLTRDCAAAAAGVPLQPHPEAVALIEERFGEAAYPTRIQMAMLPRGAEIIPNPYNRIPGFSINRHYFLPGFPEMAWPMAEWVVECFYPSTEAQLTERSVQVSDTPESELVGIMGLLKERFPEVKPYSLPRLGDNGYVELGIRGRGDISMAFTALQEALRARQIPFR
ncbi:MAG: competence/damage-inducible protein A [Candidatus Thiodiazotropha sp. (ex Ctena orbiculata)]|nr:competence/damage-inducible protein A [Candidatus Thiodiazotropha taylori]PUB82163.1 MAG: competence/damage-inducible protein A [gamma proteobacterium symbiont of Ctena orbiculata]MBT2998536.1 competence/damage-inducible protein A [Candidatus Thiodiazotropha taylori]MBT3002709.1 competence/damage-inducible protein A [Candidatus Thiodiazotropha taylori]MBT3028850.1 competence/damage-inducible protein A [Candidatus Thiodiazotropha taylori]